MMTENMHTALLALAAYLIGAIPFGLLIGLARGVDVRRFGSRNIGATNVGRVLGRKWGYLCLALDILKGLGPTLTARFLLVEGELSEGESLRWLAVALATVLGHVFPVYLRFRGGKGVATTIGATLGIYPYCTIAIAVALVGYTVVRFGTGVVSLGSLTLAVLFPLSLYVCLLVNRLSMADSWPLQAAAILLGGLILLRHHSNIRRLWHGEETRSRPADADDAPAESRL